MKKSTIADIAAIIIWLLPIIYFIKIYPELSERVPLHFGLDGKPDRYGSKEELVWAVLLLSIVTISIYYLIKFLPRIDPKKTAGYSAEAFKKIAFALLILLSGIQFFVINASITGSFGLDKLLFPFLGLFFTYLGNIMHSIKPNYFVGIRTPWTLENEDTWRATHQLAGKIWFAGGILITMATLFLPIKSGFVIFISGVVVMALVPVVYSYLYFNNHKQ